MRRSPVHGTIGSHPSGPLAIGASAHHRRWLKPARSTDSMPATTRTTRTTRTPTKTTTKKTTTKKTRQKCSNFAVCGNHCRAGRAANGGELLCEGCSRRQRQATAAQELKKCEPCSAQAGREVLKKHVSGGKCAACRVAQRTATAPAPAAGEEESAAARACAACAKAPTALLPGGKCKLCTAASSFAASGHVTFQVRPTAAEFRRGVEWGTTTGASMAHCFVMVRLKTAKEVWCIYLLVRFVLFRRYGIIAALLEPAKRGLTARAVAQRAAAALLQVLGRRGRSVGGRLSE